MRKIVYADETAHTFIPSALPPHDPPLEIVGAIAQTLQAALTALGRLQIAAHLVPNHHWFLYGFVRKEAVVTSQIEGTQATLRDLLSYEATHESSKPLDVAEICNYVDALGHARKRLSDPKGLPVCTRLLCEAHAKLMRGGRGADKSTGVIRTTQNWIGGSRPGTASFVPPPPDELSQALSAFDRWIHAEDTLPPLVRVGLAHVQFETIHPFLDGNGRIGRLLIALLLEHWGLLDAPLLYISLAFKRHRSEYYQRLTAVRSAGDWEGWIQFFLRCVNESAEDGTAASVRLFTLIDEDRRRLLVRSTTSVSAMRLFDVLPEHPVMSAALAVKLLKTTKPTAAKSIETLVQAGILTETTGMKRDRLYTYSAYLSILAIDTQVIPHPPNEP